MAKAKQAETTQRWDNTKGTYLAGQAAIDGNDAVAIDLEQYWGAGRLRLLVDTELREKFDRQRFRLQAAIDHAKEPEDVRTEARRMTVAWWTLDKAAKAAGAEKLSPLVWETVLPDGTVAALVRNPEDARAVTRDGRRVAVYTLEELAVLLGNYREVVDSKLTFPGATVTAIRKSIADPLERIRDGYSLDETFDELPGWS